MGQLGLIALRDRRADRLVPLGGSPTQLRTALDKIMEDGLKCSGQCSLINAINVSTNMLNAVGEHSNKEIIFIIGALTTIDPKSPESTIAQGIISYCFSILLLLILVSAAGIRCSIVSLSAEVFIWRKLAERTSGDYYVPLDAPSILEKLELLSRPPKDMSAKQAVLVRMGFPVKESVERYLCPQCKNRVKCKFWYALYTVRLCLCLALPTTCDICKLCLVSAPHLARSYHHLFPPAMSLPCIPDDDDINHQNSLVNSESTETESKLNRLQLERRLFNKITECVGCGLTPSNIDEGRQFVRCQDCSSCICHVCDAFIDNDLHSCPGCC